MARLGLVIIIHFPMLMRLPFVSIQHAHSMYTKYMQNAKTIVQVNVSDNANFQRKT